MPRPCGSLARRRGDGCLVAFFGLKCGPEPSLLLRMFVRCFCPGTADVSPLGVTLNQVFFEGGESAPRCQFRNWQTVAPCVWFYSILLYGAVA